MKKMKKLASLLLALVMTLAMAIPAFAANNNPYTISVKQNKDDKLTHTYNAYQIFAGDLSSEGKLSNVIWGNAVSDTAGLLAALKAETAFNDAFADCEDAADVAEVLSDTEAFKDSDISNATLTDTFATVVEPFLSTVAGTATGTGDVIIDVTGAGYYLVKDVSENLSSDGAYTRFLLEVVNNATVNVKSEVPSGDKQLYTEDADGNIVPGDANFGVIGSHVSYVITSKVPNHVGYDYYYFIMNDTLSKGLTFDGASTVKVTVGGVELAQGTDYYVYTGTDAGAYTFRLAFADIMNYEVGKEIKVTYSATVNGDAVIGTTGNPNTWKLDYSNNPNDTYDGTQDSNKPGLPDESKDVVLGETPEEKTLTYVTALDITKYANEIAEANKLAGAEFTLTGTSYQVVLKEVEYYEVSANGTYYLLKDGTYTETAPTGTEYVEVGVGTETTTTGYIKNAEGEYVVPTNTEDYKGQTLYRLVKGTAGTYVDVNTKYEKKKDLQEVVEKVPVNISMAEMTGEDGKISFERLGAGEYTLTETVTPEGFNTLDPISFEIKFTAPTSVSDGSEKCTWEFVSKTDGFTIENDTVAGTAAANIINKSGSLLPSTGGIGTTIFYVVGTILVLGAGILLVTKRRMKAQ